LSLRKGEESDIVVMDVSSCRVETEEGCLGRCRRRDRVECRRRVNGGSFLTEVEWRRDGRMGAVDFATVAEVFVRVDSIDRSDERRR
jgi:hypothetical protein